MTDFFQILPLPRYRNIKEFRILFPQIRDGSLTKYAHLFYLDHPVCYKVPRFKNGDFKNLTWRWVCAWQQSPELAVQPVVGQPDTLELYSSPHIPSGGSPGNTWGCTPGCVQLSALMSLRGWVLFP